jgi:exosortase
MVEEFVTDLRSVWSQVPGKGLFLGLLLAWLALFHLLGNSTFGYFDTPSLLRWVYGVYTTPESEDGHGLLIPWVVLALFWWKRRELLALPRAAWWPGLLLLAAALLLHIAGYLIQQPRISLVAMFAGIYALIGLVWGRAWMVESLFPFALLMFCIPLASLSEMLTFPMRLLVAKIAVGFSHFVLGVDVVRDGTQIFDLKRTFQYDVAPACSGIRSLISLVALTTIYGFLTFRAWWKRALMVFIAIPLAVAGNVLRIIGVIVAAEAFGHDAGTMVEQKLGFLTFLVALIGIFIIGHLLRERVKPQSAPRDLETKNA